MVRELAYPLPATLAKALVKYRIGLQRGVIPLREFLHLKQPGFKSGFNSGLDGNLKNFCSWQYRLASVLEKYLIYLPGAET